MLLSVDMPKDILMETQTWPVIIDNGPALGSNEATTANMKLILAHFSDSYQDVWLLVLNHQLYLGNICIHS